MFTLITGKPGSSKTSHLIDLIHFSGQFKGRDVYYRGIGELKLPWFELSDDETRAWPENVPDGAVLVVDEAQEIWPVRAPSRPVPSGLTALEKHRHRGVDVFFLSQDPSLLDKHARTLANEHKHYSRPFGAPVVIEYHSGSGFVSPENSSELSKCNQTKRALPKRVWGLYKSAETHTHKFRPPKMLFIVPLIALFAAFLIYRFVSGYGASDDAEVIQNQPGVESVQGLRGGSPEEKEQRTWSELLTPEIPTLPWTAPLYKDKAMQVKSVPRVAGCLASKSVGCKCYTQQGTVLSSVTEAMCRNHVEYGQFDHMIGPDNKNSQDELSASTS